MARRAVDVSVWRIGFFFLTSALFMVGQYSMNETIRSLTRTGEAGAPERSFFGFSELDLTLTLLDFTPEARFYYFCYLGVDLISIFFTSMFLCDALALVLSILLRNQSSSLFFIDTIPFFGAAFDLLENLTLFWIANAFPLDLELPPLTHKIALYLCLAKHYAYLLSTVLIVLIGILGVLRILFSARSSSVSKKEDAAKKTS